MSNWKETDRLRRRADRRATIAFYAWSVVLGTLAGGTIVGIIQAVIQ